jgi:hypothetical protein
VQLCARAALRPVRELLPSRAAVNSGAAKDSVGSVGSASVGGNPSTSASGGVTSDARQWDDEWRRIAGTQAPPQLRPLSCADFAAARKVRRPDRERGAALRQLLVPHSTLTQGLS